MRVDVMTVPGPLATMGDAARRTRRAGFDGMLLTESGRNIYPAATAAALAEPTLDYSTGRRHLPGHRHPPRVLQPDGRHTRALRALRRRRPRRVGPDMTGREDREIRLAHPADLDVLVDLHRTFCDADRHPFDVDRARAAFGSLLRVDDGRLRGLVRIFLETESHNDGARSFYGRHGFTVDDSIWMSRGLT